VEGSCHDYVLAYSYVSSSGRCEAFYYGGCEGNENRFESAEDCESECMSATTRRPQVQTERPDVDTSHDSGLLMTVDVFVQNHSFFKTTGVAYVVIFRVCS